MNEPSASSAPDAPHSAFSKVERLPQASDDPTVTVVQSEAFVQMSPHVSVCIVTYNQSDLIGEAIDSALNQDVDFPYEIIVGDDFSTDGTRDILRSYQQSHPERIRLNLHDEHFEGITARKNMVTNLESARGTYVALLDGDDYWISMDKLQRQTAFLDAHPDVVLSFHDAVSKYNSPGARNRHTQRADAVPPGSKYSERFHDTLSTDRYFSHDAIVDWTCSSGRFAVPASSVMFRHSLFSPVPTWFWKVFYADTVLQSYLSSLGKVYYHADLLGCRRYTSQSVSTRPMTLADRNIVIQELNVMESILPSFSADGALSASHLWQMRYWMDRRRWDRALRSLLRALPNYIRFRTRQLIRSLRSFLSL